jgi:hypothetical protein
MPDFKRATNHHCTRARPLEPRLALPKSVLSALPFGVPANAPAIPAERLAYRFT